MKTSKIGIDLIKSFEGLVLKTYICDGNVKTIGYGTTIIKNKPVKSGMTITKEQAEEYLKDDLIQFERIVNRSVKSKINQNQFDSLVSIVYNIGGYAFKNSTLLKLVNYDPNDKNIHNEFMRWTRANGVILNGLIRRRKAESELYFS